MTQRLLKSERAKTKNRCKVWQLLLSKLDGSNIRLTLEENT